MIATGLDIQKKLTELNRLECDEIFDFEDIMDAARQYGRSYVHSNGDSLYNRIPPPKK